MKSIAFIDIEIDPKTKAILDFGGIDSEGNTIHSNFNTDIIKYIEGSRYLCGHNIFDHDIKYLTQSIQQNLSERFDLIDTLHLSPLLFPEFPYHALLKDDKLQTEELNNPLSDAKKAKELFWEEVSTFNESDKVWKNILFLLLRDKIEFKGFFRFLGFLPDFTEIESLILKQFEQKICENVNLFEFIQKHPVELAYCLALIRTDKKYSITPPWVLKNYPKVEGLYFRLRNKPCISGCQYCNQSLNSQLALKEFFGFENYRYFGGDNLQEKAVDAAINGKSMLAVFPTGGGKSLTFQVPALMSGRNVKGLTVIVSPLQSLMKDQVDNLEKSGITDAVTINGSLDPIERGKSFERVENGEASILYISPESLRSKSIERLILNRNIVRFVIDEAHCFSVWGQDFRVDYLYIGEFIREIQKKKNLEESIPVSCFTATAKQNVIQDIQAYFLEELNLNLLLFTTTATRTNLKYKVYENADEEEKYNMVRSLIDEKDCPTIVYVSRTRKAYLLAERLQKDGYEARPYHGKMDKSEKAFNQDAFIQGKVQVMIATSAFGMGVDKKDIGMVIHYEISDSLENYIQEAGRAGRDESMEADCFVLFNEEDLSKHFILLNQTKLSIKEIQQVWRAIKNITNFRSKVSYSALEIARKAGWDDNVVQIENRVTTAIAALENAGYLKRGQNMPRIFASSILTKNAQEAIDKIHSSTLFTEKQVEQAVRIVKKLFSSKSRKQNNDDAAESRVDYISDHLGIVKEEVIQIINLLREEKILADNKDLTAFIKLGESKNLHLNRSLKILESFAKLERFLLTVFQEEEQKVNLKELNELAEIENCKDVNPSQLKSIINFWAIKNWINRKNLSHLKNYIVVLLNHNKEVLLERLNKRHELSQFITEFLYSRALQDNQETKVETLVEFSVHELKEAFEKQAGLFQLKCTIDEVEDALFYLSRIEAIKIEGGFLVVYNRLNIERLEKNNKRNFKLEDYKVLDQFYNNKIQQIHIVGEYAQRMLDDYQKALQFAEDYFQLNYSSFLQKYFNVDRQEEIKRNITPAKFKQLFGELSSTQLSIINDKHNQYIVVPAGPGSGKTRVLVHKLASLILMEDVKYEQLLMLTFSRAAATEFKKRLFDLIKGAAAFVDIKTFHSYCFDLLGKVGNLEKSNNIIKTTVDRIKNDEVEPSRITKTVLVIDEAQDMDENEFALVKALMEFNEDMRVIAVGDDDQNIYEFRGASAKYLTQFIEEKKAIQHELVENYRSKVNLVDFSNQFVEGISKRLKKIPIVAKQQNLGSIKITNYKSSHLISPVVEEITNTELKGTTCVLTRTNEQASQITALLLRKGMQAKLIQTNDGFNLYNLFEVRYFYNLLNLTEEICIISNDRWELAKRELEANLQKSSKLEVCLNLLRDFEAIHPKRRFKSDLEVFIRESKLEDFFNEGGESIFVSTIHKVKGKEFDNVFLMLEDFNPNTDAIKRQWYVALTRAKSNLNIHLNGPYLENISTQNLGIKYDDKLYNPPKQMAIRLSLSDVWLDYFIKRQYAITQLKSGDELRVGEDALLNQDGIPFVKFSKKAQEKIALLKQQHYMLKTAKVNFMVYWQKEGEEKEVIVVLPELEFERNTDSNLVDTRTTLQQ